LALGHTETKVHDLPGNIPGAPSSSSIGVTKIMKLMTKPFLFALLSPLGSDLTSLLQSKEKGIEKGDEEEKKKNASATGGTGVVRKNPYDGCDEGHAQDPHRSRQKKNCSSRWCRSW
jgi:hypothetical protein